MENIHASDPEERLRIGDAARLAGVSVDTMRRWAAKGHVKFERRPSGDRVFRRGDVEALNKPVESAGAEPSAAAS